MTRLKLPQHILDLNPGVASSIAIADGTRAEKRARTPRAAADERTGLTTLLIDGWSTQCPMTPEGWKFRLYKHGVGDTGLCDDEAQACARARDIIRKAKP